MERVYTWDPAKAIYNFQVHGISFETAVEVFDDAGHVVAENYCFEAEGEQRYAAIGMAGNLLLLLVVFVDRSNENEEVIRIISARKAVKYEQKIYAAAAAQTENHR